MTSSNVLTRTLGLPSLVLLGLAYMTPIIVLGIFGIVAEITAGASASAYLVALIAMVFTASSYARLAAAYPVAGSAYTYVGKTVDSRVGFLVGWAVLLDYLFLPMVIWLIGASYLNAQFPSVPNAVWVLAFIALTTFLNILGIKVADRANFVLMAFQTLVLILFVVFAILFIVGANGAGGLVNSSPFVGIDASFGAITAGAAVAAYCFLGFDAVTTFTEEAIDPRRTVPKAIMLVALLGGGIFVAVSYVTQLVHPGGTFENSGSAAFDIAGQIGGALFSAIFVAGLVVAQFTSGLAAQASASRLIFAMGRDGVLPRRLFGSVNAKLKTPVTGIVVIGLVGLAALFLDITTSTSFINFGAFTAFTFVNIAVIAHFAREAKKGNKLNPLVYLVMPGIGAIVDAYLLMQLDSNALTLGFWWLGIGVVALLIITRAFTRKPPVVMDAV